MNKVELIGRIVRDPDVKNNGTTTIAKFTLAVNRRFRQANSTQTADFISCVAFGKNAEFAEKYFHKGMKISVVGHIQTGSYVNKDGKTVYTSDVFIEESDFCESKSSNESYTPADQGMASAPTSAPQANATPSANESFMNMPDNFSEELPF